MLVSQICKHFHKTNFRTISSTESKILFYDASQYVEHYNEVTKYKMMRVQKKTVLHSAEKI